MAAQAFPLGQRPNPLGSTGVAGLQPEQGNPGAEQALAGRMIDPRQANQMEAIREILAGMSPDEQKEFLTKLATSQQGLGDIGQDQQFQGNRMLSNAIRNQPQGRTTSGGLYTAANPLEFAGNLAQVYVGNERYKEGLGARKQAIADQAEKNKLDLDSQLNMGNGQMSMGDALRY